MYCTCIYIQNTYKYYIYRLHVYALHRDIYTYMHASVASYIGSNIYIYTKKITYSFWFVYIYKAYEYTRSIDETKALRIYAYV